MCCVMTSIGYAAYMALLIFKTGLNRSELDFVWSMVCDGLVKHYEAKHHQRDPPLLPFASLLLTLYWLRHYPTIRCMAVEFGVSATHMQECVDHCMYALFMWFASVCFSDHAVPHRGYRAGGLGGVRLLVDSTWLTLPHTEDGDDRKRFYHYKSPTKQALKWQLCTTTDGIPWDVSDVVYGR